MPIWKVVVPSAKSDLLLESNDGVLDEPNAFALRAWPLLPESVSKIQFWVQAAECFQVTAKTSPFPVPLRWGFAEDCPYAVSGECYYWTLANWRRGLPLEQAQVNSTLRCRLVCWLASIHQTTHRVGERHAPSIGLKERGIQIANLVSRLSSVGQRESRPVDPSSEFGIAYNLPFDPFLQKLQFFERQFRHRWGAWLDQPLPLQWIVRDLWRDNVLLQDGRWISIVDLGAARVEWPLFDLLRLLGSLATTHDEWDECIRTYYDQWGTKPSFATQSLRVIHAVSVGLSIHHWLEQRNRLIRERVNRFGGQNALQTSFNNALLQRMDRRLGELLVEWELCDEEDFRLDT